MEDRIEVREDYAFSDWLYYTAAALVPLFTGAVAIYPQSALGLVSYGGVVLAGVAVVMHLFCTHCPHYQKPGRFLKCIFFWGLPKFFAPRNGSLTRLEKLVAVAAMGLVLFFPLAWLAEEPGLLLVYLLSLAVFLATVRRHECRRCVFSDCPANAVPGQTPGRQGNEGNVG
ncbi:MAG: hypothetical protein JRF23_06160 [Deltaproteobacteria bacterium]|nr:hypothetical protein [Deltaproteobacteria bacterium]